MLSGQSNRQIGLAIDGGVSIIGKRCNRVAGIVIYLNHPDLKPP